MSDAAGNYYKFNKRWLDFRGRSMEQELDLGWSEGVHRSDLGAYLAVYNKAYSEKKSFDTEFRLKRADGEYRLMMVKAEPQYEDGVFSGYVGTCIDITDRMIMQAHTERISALLDETNAIAKVGGWEYDITSNEITWTKEVYKIFGVKQDEKVKIKGGDAFRFCYPDDQNLLKVSFKEAFTTGKSFNIEFRVVTVSGNVLWVNAQGKSVVEKGQITRIIGALQDITQQRNADMALIESERMLHFVIDSLPVSVYLTDKNGHITNYNKRAEDLWGRKPQKGSSKWEGSHKLYTDSGELISEENNPMALATKNNKTVYGEELISECENGSRTNVIAFVTPYKNSKGELEGALNVLVDITERKQLEEKLTGLSLVARKTSNAVIISDAQARITWVNQSFTKISGYTLSEAMGKRPSDFLHCEETNPDTVAYAYKALEKQEPVRFEILNKGKHGNKYWLDIDVQPLRDPEGKLSGFISVETDITELKYIHEELKKSENKLRAILDSTSDDNVLVDPDYKIISINKVAIEHLTRAFGTEPAIGQLIWNYVDPGIRHEFEQTFNQAIAGFACKKEQLLTLRKEVRMWFEFSFYPVYAHNGSLIGVAINSKNIHAKKTAELKVQHQNRKLKEIAFTQSHTLRRPVANILGLWNLISKEIKGQEGKQELLELINYLGRSVTEMDEVIREITYNTRNMKV